MKKFLLITFVLSLIFLSGCSKGLTPAPSEAASEEETTALPVVTITFPEGMTAVEIAEKLEENGVCSAEDFMAEVMNVEEIREAFSFAKEINTENKAFYLEGYIFPDTYEFYLGESAKTAISRFLKNTEAKLSADLRQRATELGYSLDEVIILASIIQSECGFPNEVKRVSSVLHNRIESADYGRLQCDVTINYINNFVSSSPYLSENTERFKELYNTYKCKGLPAGAICNPGLDAIEAALYPDETNYFFFVTDKDWNYYYAETYSEHKENCRRVGLTG
ncbi:MAG: endolytic transglycosylase MltG [Clostridia bacterium]|nr:endolytic transglycosylase MltG [Clostridia bacterium]